MSHTSPVGERDMIRSMRAAMGQAQSAPVVSLFHPRWCGQRLAELLRTACLAADRRVQ